MANERLLKTMRDLGVHLEIELVKSLIAKGHNATGDLVNSVETIIEEFKNGVRLTEKHLFYGDFKDRGRKRGGKRVPVDAIEDWLKQRRFSFAIEDTRGTAFAVQTNIFKFGIKPTRWLSEVLDNEEDRIVRDISSAVGQDMEILIENLVNRAQRNLAA